ncbi:hypothetical protein DFQ30_006977 [Apophysomyces sp. BC1015]|nr:hypothetical protein DFQ30_006977 [Apophysomyces sp. BC1015]KAG0179319.1 hypothetical protein DFQ29_002263 [Apophysomyces sp. BC1021]
MEAIPDIDDLWCVKINQAARTTNGDAKEILKSWVRSDDTDEACRYQDVYKSMLKAYGPYYDAFSVNEGTFVKEILLPLLAAYFPDDSTIFTKGANGAVSGSSRRKRQTDPDTQARKGDFNAYMCDKHLSQLVVTFYPEKIELNAMTVQLKAQGIADKRLKYNGDGKILVNNIGTEVLLSEVSSAFAENNKAKTSFDHYKAMFGLLVMLRTLAGHYKHASFDTFKKLN